MTSVGPSAMQVDVQRQTPMPRPARSKGTLGREVKLESNFFKIGLRGLRDVYQYDVEIRKVKFESNGKANGIEDVAQRQPTNINRTIFRRWLLERGNKARVAYDGRKIVYGAKELPPAALSPGGHVMKCDREGGAVAPDTPPNRYDEVTVYVKHVATLDAAVLTRGSNVGPNVQPVINALDVAMSEGNTRRFVEVGRTFYSDSGAVGLTGGAQAWRGFYQSIRVTQGGLTINVDESFTPFWMNGSLLNLCKEAHGRANVPATSDVRSWQRLGKELYSLRVRARHTNITYRVFGFSSTGADRTYFVDKATNQRTSVAEYMHKEYGYALEHPGLPCAKTNPKRDIFVPVELLDVCLNQRRAKAMTPNQTTNMIRAAALKPEMRRNSARQSIAKAGYNKDETCKDFGLVVDNRMVSVDARVLQTPALLYNGPGPGRKSVNVTNGSWNMARNRVIRGATLQHWVVVQVGRGMRRDHIAAFMHDMVKIGIENGVNITNEEPEIIDNMPEHRVEQKLKDLVMERHGQIGKKFPRRGDIPRGVLQLVVVIKEKQDTNIYNAVKRVCDVECGVASQVLLSRKILKQTRVEQYIANVWLKINVKLGGGNVLVQPYAELSGHNPAFISRPHIVLGADVTHPAPGSGGRPSVAALVGSRDIHGTQFSGAIRNQASRQEIISDMGGMFAEVYQRWWLNFEPKVDAEAIIMFRDGVSEGQYQQVLDVELPAIRQTANALMKKGVIPKITYIIVTKRHHTRFFGGAETRNSDLDRSKNVVAGTVVDTGVTSPNVWDFYLNSHAGIQGTNRPSKYTVLYDENNFTADELQCYIFRLTHGYARCTRSVSMVNAAYYAHLLAFRGRVFLGEEGSDDGASSTGGGAGSASSAIPPTLRPHPQVESGLFFV